MASLSLQHLDKKFPDGSHAVRDLSLQVHDGEFVVLVGPSGCGKSTTLRLVAGLEEPTSGEVFIGERLMNQVSPGRRDIAMVFQNHALYPHMSVYQNMAFGLRMRRTPRTDIEKQVPAAARILSIESLLERRPGELSGGERQRVALGRAIVRAPKVFLFDEPLSNLDATLRVQMRAEIARLHRRLGTTVIYVTHDQVEAMTLGQRVVVMDQGIIQQVDTPMNIYRKPANRFVASFIGSPAMNFFPGTVQAGVFQFSDGPNGQVESGIDAGLALPDGSALLGVRPEDFLIAGAASRAVPGPLGIDGPTQEAAGLGTVTVDVVEHLGHETIAHFELAGNSYVARLPANAAVEPGHQVPLAIRPGAFHLFSARDGRRLN
jgi:multiple sugar transport system ATP-binding protein